MRQPGNDSGGSTTAFWREIIPQKSSALKKNVSGEDFDR